LARPLSFNPDEKLQVAMSVFWRNGFNESSLAMLLDEMAINKYSLYRQFGNKEALFSAALDCYNQNIFNKVLKPLKQSHGKSAINAYLEAFSVYIESPLAQHGCLIMNTLIAGNALPSSHREKARDMAKQLHHLLTVNFQAEKDKGNLKQDVKACVDFTIMTIQALINTRKAQGLKVTKSNIRFFQKALKDW
jgi:AcrR family transcriptional regulator